jgi:hypothetical protein
MSYDDWKCTEPDYLDYMPLEPDCKKCSDDGCIVTSHDEVIVCDCDSEPYYERQGGYSSGPLFSLDSELPF